MGETTNSVVAEPVQSHSSGAPFFTGTAGAAFFPDGIVQRKCEDCEKEEKKIQRQDAGVPDTKPDVVSGADAAATPAAPAAAAPAASSITMPRHLTLGIPALIPPALPGMYHLDYSTIHLPETDPLQYTAPDSNAGKPDYFSLTQPYRFRGAGPVGDRDFRAIESLYLRNQDFAMRILGLPPDLAAKFSNTATSIAIDNGLKGDFPTVIEKSNEGTGTHTINGPVLHFKLTVNQPNDPYEQEADALAGKVLQKKPAEVTLSSPETRQDGAAQRKCTHCEEEEKEKKIQRKDETAEPVVSPAIEEKLDSSKGQGQPLPDTVNADMGDAFGTDFSQVTVHTDASSVQMNKDLNAQAFTYGNDIYFNSGKYDPGTDGGKFLLAHELTHVIQQTGGGGAVDRKIQRDDAGVDAGPDADTETVSEDVRLHNKGVDQPESGEQPPVEQQHLITDSDKSPKKTRIVNWNKNANRRTSTLRAPGFTGDTSGTHISHIDVTIHAIDEKTFSEVRLTWAHLEKSKGYQVKDNLKTSPGAGKCNTDCTDVSNSQKDGSHCTPIGNFTVQGFADHLPGDVPAKYVTWYNHERGIAFHIFPVPAYPASHGCTRMDDAQRGAEWIYDNSLAGITTVTITRNASEGPGPKCWEKGNLMDRPAPKASVKKKAMVNTAGDRYEQEADAMAERVVQRTEDEKGGEPADVAGPMIQMKCAGCEAEEKKIQRAPGEPAADPRKRHKEIDYKAAAKTNLDTWAPFYKFFNLFAEDRIYPGSDPIEYANRVFELQQQLMTHVPEWKGNSNGILETALNNIVTLDTLVGYASLYAEKKADPAESAKANILHLNEKMLDRLARYQASYDKTASPLVSDFFKDLLQWNLLVNRFTAFSVSIGDSGDYVAALQNALLFLKYDIGGDVKKLPGKDKPEVSGKFGIGTQKAVKSFQQDAGLEGKDVDGVVGSMTIRLLDERIGATPKKEEQSGGNSYLFLIPVTIDMVTTDEIKKKDVKDQLLRDVLRRAFSVNDAEIDGLIEAKWHWEPYQEPTLENVAKNDYKVFIRKTEYESIAGKVETGPEGKGEKSEDAAHDKAESLGDTEMLYELDKKVKAKELEYGNLLFGSQNVKRGRDGLPISTPSKQSQILQVKKDLDDLKGQRDAELKRLNITLDKFESLKKAFIESFERFAVQEAYKLLLENSTKANIEYQRYNNPEAVGGLKKAIGEISKCYGEADAAFMKGISLEQKGDPNKFKTAEEYFDYYSSDPSASEGQPAPDIKGLYYTHKFNSARADNLKKRSENNEGYQSYYDKELSAVEKVAEWAKVYPILAYPRLELQERSLWLSQKSDDDLKTHVLTLINNAKDNEGVLPDIDKTRTRIKEDPEMIWELPAVLVKAQDDLGILPESTPGRLIADTLKEKKQTDFWTKIGLAALGLTLGLLALASGPIGWIALAGSLTLGVIDAYKTYQDITSKRESYDTALDPVDALGQENPDYFWFVVSLVSVGLDVLMAVKVVKQIKGGLELAEGAKKALQAEADQVLKKLAEGGQDAKEAYKLNSQLERLTKAIDAAGSETGEYIKNLNLLKPLKDNPLAMRVLMNALKDADNVKAFTKLSKMVGSSITKEVYEATIRFYAGMGKKGIGELPELVRLIEEGGSKGLKSNPALLQQVLTDTRLQSVLLRSGDPAVLLVEFEKWSKTTGRSFVDFLKEAGYETKFAKGKSLAEALGEGFASLPTAVQNRQILRMIEPRLLDAFNNKTLSKDLSKALEALLKGDILGKTKDLATAQERVRAGLKQVAESLELQSDYSQLAGLLDSVVSQAYVARSAVNIFGQEQYIALLEEIAKTRAISPQVKQELLRIGPMTDRGTIERLIADDPLRKILAEEPLAVQALKKCASPCFPPNMTAEQVKTVAGIMKGRSSQDIAKINQYLYENRETLEEAVRRLEASPDKILKDVKLVSVRLPVKFRDLAAINEIMSGIEKTGAPMDQVNNILKNYERLGLVTPRDFALELLSFLQRGNNVGFKNTGKILDGLEKGSKAEFQLAELLMEDGVRFSQRLGTDLASLGANPTLRKLDILLEKWSLQQLGGLRKFRFEDSFVNVIFSISERLGHPNPEALIELVSKAKGGGPKENLERVWTIIKGLEKDAVSLKDAEAAVQGAEEFAANVAKALADPKTGLEQTAKLVWGAETVIENDIVKVPGRFKAGVPEAGSAAIEMILGKNSTKARDLVAGLVKGAEIDGSGWSVLKKSIESADIAPGIRNNIIGELWTRVNIERLVGAGFDRSQLIREVEITVAGATAKADVVALKDGKMFFYEFKSLAGDLSPTQKIVYPALEEAIKTGNFRKLFVNNKDLRKLFTDSRIQKLFKKIEESTFLAKGGKL